MSDQKSKLEYFSDSYHNGNLSKNSTFPQNESNDIKIPESLYTKSGTTVEQSKKISPHPQNPQRSSIISNIPEISISPLKPQSAEQALKKRQKQIQDHKNVQDLTKTTSYLHQTYKGDSKIAEEQQNSKIEEIIVKKLESIRWPETINENHGILFDSNITQVPLYYLSRQQ